MVVRSTDQTMIHLSEIIMVVIESTTAFLSSYLLAKLAESHIPVIFCDIKHNPIGQYLPLYGAHDSSRRIQEQILWNAEVGRQLWQQIIKSKIRNQSFVLSQVESEQSQTLLKYADEVLPGDSTNREGHAAKVYFNTLFGNHFSRDINHPINTQLNYGYSVLLAWLNREITSRGYLTQLGIHHCNDYNEFNLSCDFMEPFRPVIDLYVLSNYERGLGPDVKAELLNLFSHYYRIKAGQYRLSSILSLCTKANIGIMSSHLDMDSYIEFNLYEN